MIELTYFGHSSLKIKKNNTVLYLDPWFNSPSFPSNETRSIEDNSFILVSHGHLDHFETAHEVAQKQQVKVVVNFESTVENICKYISEEIISAKLPDNISCVNVRVYETVDAYTEVKVNR